MPARIPNLWRTHEDAERLYAFYLYLLEKSGDLARLIAACREIRRHARRDPGLKRAAFTYALESYALGDLGRFSEAWRAHRAETILVHGRAARDFLTFPWKFADTLFLRMRFAPLLFHLGRHHEACALYETSLMLQLRRRHAESYDLLNEVYDDSTQPRRWCYLTLKQLYDSLGRDLRDWKQWNRFIDRFHPKLFQLAKIPSAAVRTDSENFLEFARRLSIIRAQRCTSGSSTGLLDLIDPSTVVQKRQQALKQKYRLLRARRAPPIRDEIMAQLKAHFPEVRRMRW